MKEYTKNLFLKIYRGQFYLNFVASIYDAIFLFGWILDPLAAKSRKKIRSYKNKYKNERCFIIGNGPSLKKMDLSLLKNEYTFGLNRFYLESRRSGFNPDFLVSVNRLVIEQSSVDMNKIKYPKFINWKSRDLIIQSKNTIFVNSLVRKQFAKNIEWGMWEGATVTYVALQIAYYMGFNDVFLIGIDHYFKNKGPAHKEVVAKGSDNDHFDPNYFGKGFRWNLPDLEMSESAYRMAQQVFQKNNRMIFDATINGRLKIFKKVSYKNLFK